jgi:haloalkane dehalogenase
LSDEHRVVAVDDVGFGRSDKPRDPAYYTLERHVANLEATLAKLDVQNAVLVVQDWGGPIGMGWATRHPDRVKGVVVMNTWAFVRGEGSFDLPWLFRFLVLGKGGWKRATKGNVFTELFLVKGGARKLDEATADAYRAPHPTPEDRVGIGRFPQLIPEKSNPGHESFATLARIEDDLAKLAGKPALIVWALKDRAFRKPQLERWKKVFPRHEGPHLLADAGHYLQEDAPERILPHVKAWAAKLG